MNRGILSGHHDHPMQVPWSCTYLQDDGDPGKIQTLDKLDVECLGFKDQIKIAHRCVLIHASSWCQGVWFDVKLPPQVQCVIVKKFGNSQPYCFFTERGQKTKKGDRLRWDPFAV